MFPNPSQGVISINFDLKDAENVSVQITDMNGRIVKELLNGTSVIGKQNLIADLNDLKQANDTLGHQAGDKLIRRAAEVFTAAFGPEQLVARIGGDEFIIILPDTPEDVVVEYIKQIDALIRLNNKYYREPELSISLGAATSKPGVLLEKVINVADDAMYRNKGDIKRRRKGD